jgi:hypothetical protein
MNRQKVIEQTAAYLKAYGVDENDVFGIATELYDLIAPMIESNAFLRSATRMQQMEDIAPGGTMPVQKAIDYLVEAAQRVLRK